MSSLKKCYFNYDTLEAKVGNVVKGYEILNCLKVPTFKRNKKERESLGNGWYGEKITVEVIYDKCFIIIKDNKPFGLLIDPYYEPTIKSNIYAIDKPQFKEIEHFIKNIQ